MYYDEYSNGGQCICRQQNKNTVTIVASVQGFCYIVGVNIIGR
jgi:hypothetical protein